MNVGVALCIRVHGYNGLHGYNSDNNNNNNNQIIKNKQLFIQD